MADFTVKIREQRSVSGTFEAIVEAAAGISIEVDSAGALYCKECGIELSWDHNQRAADEKIVADPEASAEAKRNAQARLDAMKNLAYTTKAGRFTFAYSGFNADGPGHFTAKGFAGVKGEDKIPFMQWSPDTGVLTPDAPRASARLVTNEDCPMIGELRIDVMNSASAMITADASAREATATRTAFKDDTPARAHAVANFERTRYDETTFEPIVDQVTLSADWTVYSFDGPEQWSDAGETRWVETANTMLGAPHGVDFRGCTPPLPNGVIPYQGGVFYYHYEHWKTAYAVDKLQKKQVSDRGRERWVDAEPAQTWQGREIGPVVTSRNSGSISARENTNGDQGPYTIFPGCDDGCEEIKVYQSAPSPGMHPSPDPPDGDGGDGGTGGGGTGGGGTGGGGTGGGGTGGEGTGGTGTGGTGEGTGGEGGEGEGGDTGGGEEEEVAIRFPFRGGTRQVMRTGTALLPEITIRAVSTDVEWLTLEDTLITCAPRDPETEDEAAIKEERTGTITVEIVDSGKPEDVKTETWNVAQDGKFHCVPDTLDFPVNSGEPTKVEFRFGTPVSQLRGGDHIGATISLDGTVDPWDSNPRCYFHDGTARGKPHVIAHSFTAADGQVAPLTLTFAPPSTTTRRLTISPTTLPVSGGTLTITATVPENEICQLSPARFLWDHSISHNRTWGRSTVVIDMPANISLHPQRWPITVFYTCPPICRKGAPGGTFVVAVSQDGTDLDADAAQEEFIAWLEPEGAVPAEGGEVVLRAYINPTFLDRTRDWELTVPEGVEVVDAFDSGAVDWEWTLRVAANPDDEPRSFTLKIVAPKTPSRLPTLATSVELWQDGRTVPAPTPDDDDDNDDDGGGGGTGGEGGEGGGETGGEGGGEGEGGGGSTGGEGGEGGEGGSGGDEEEPAPPAEGVVLSPERIVFSALGGEAALTARFPAGTDPALLPPADLDAATLSIEMTTETETSRTWTLRAAPASRERTETLSALIAALNGSALAFAEIVLLPLPLEARTLPAEPFFREKRLKIFTPAKS